MEAPAPGTPQPRDEWYDSGDDLSHLDAPASPDPLDDTLDSHPLDSDSDRDVSHIAHDTSSEDDRDDRPPVDDLDGLANHRVLHIHGTPVGICEVHLLGTAHVSWDSARDAVRLVRAIRPDVVFLELCEARRRVIQPRPTDVPTDEPPSPSRMVEMWRRGTPVWGIVHAWMLAVAAKELGVPPGAEFAAAAAAASEVGGCEVVLGDRDVGTTLRRTWHALSVWERVRFVWAMIAGGFNVPNGDELRRMIEELKDADALTEAFKQLGEDFPSLLAPLIHERDAYMVAGLRQIAHRDPHGGNHRPCRKIVAVVGAGHCSGMEDFLSVPWAPGDVASILAEMNEVPDPRDWERSRRVIAWSVGLTLAGSVLGTVYAASMVASRLRRR
ncbi:predicted protein [Micromonas commoda]|uniref:TraB family protein n=1 Tax=Micromonas commoda (strain RCC299 / NOUM17 / CCMP2709) TaxID=296587 RepID=C1EAX9_MICCC|nr:predicted protein [Micromonas commoda]ACO65285.1 predicted protein [Micromonas commoda]|eukprot:XP_002504027.1 predicted protein [Micromonas commoda]